MSHWLAAQGSLMNPQISAWIYFWIVSHTLSLLSVVLITLGHFLWHCSRRHHSKQTTNNTWSHDSTRQRTHQIHELLITLTIWVMKPRKLSQGVYAKQNVSHVTGSLQCQRLGSMDGAGGAKIEMAYQPATCIFGFHLPFTKLLLNSWMFSWAQTKLLELQNQS